MSASADRSFAALQIFPGLILSDIKPAKRMRFRTVCYLLVQLMHCRRVFKAEVPFSNVMTCEDDDKVGAAAPREPRAGGCTPRTASVGACALLPRGIPRVCCGLPPRSTSARIPLLEPGLGPPCRVTRPARPSIPLWAASLAAGPSRAGSCLASRGPPSGEPSGRWARPPAPGRAPSWAACRGPWLASWAGQSPLPSSGFCWQGAGGLGESLRGLCGVLSVHTHLVSAAWARHLDSPGKPVLREPAVGPGCHPFMAALWVLPLTVLRLQPCGTSVLGLLVRPVSRFPGYAQPCCLRPRVLCL